MKVYKVSYRDKQDNGSHCGYLYVGSLGAAKLECEIVASHKNTSIEEIEVNSSKGGVIAALNIHGGHANNG